MSDTLCVLPWMHLATHPNGGASLCCRSNHTNAVSWAKKSDTNSLVTLDNDPLTDIINSEKFVQVRQAMIDGKKPSECEGCWRDEAAGIESKRQYENRRWEHIIPSLEKTAVIKKPNYHYVELRLGNICNNACLTCNSYSSSKWYADEKKIAQDLPWFELRPLENFKWFENPAFYDDLAECSADVSEIYINGGEPTLIKAHFGYLKKLIATGRASNVHLVYSLNMMDVPDSLIELWTSFKKVTVNCSVDDFDERNFYIRWPSVWADTVRSIEKINNIHNVDWHVAQTVSIYNIQNLEQLDNWLQDNFGKETTHNFVLYPDYLGMAAIPDLVKDELKLKYANSFNKYKRDELFAKLSVEWQPALTARAQEFATAIDKSRNLKYTEYIPELEKVLYVLPAR